MTSPQPIGLSRRVNRAILTATVAFSGGALLGLAALALAVRDERGVVASLVYGLCLILCSLCSYLYNMLETASRRGLLRYLDHAAIFLLIAGTYTPFVAAGVRGPLGIGLLQWVWGLSLLGIALKLLLRARYDRIFVGLYLAIGWLFVSAIDQILQAVTPSSLLFLAVGGIAYTVGALIYARGLGRWTDPVWHACVLAGSCSHFIAVVALRLAAHA